MRIEFKSIPYPTCAEEIVHPFRILFGEEVDGGWNSVGLGICLQEFLEALIRCFCGNFLPYGAILREFFEETFFLVPVHQPEPWYNVCHGLPVWIGSDNAAGLHKEFIFVEQVSVVKDVAELKEV